MKHTAVRAAFKSPYMKQVAERLNILKMNSVERKAYNAYLNKTRQERDHIVSAEEVGKARGIEKAREEVLKDETPMEKIVRCTGLSKEAIEKLR